MSDYDSPWKEMLDYFFAQFIAFALPQAHAEIDWLRDPESLETEMRKLLEESEVGARRIDKLVRVISKEAGDDVLLHVEAQVKPENDFERRMYVYNYKAEDRYNHPVVSVAIFGDESPEWRPNKYVFEKWGCCKTFEFVVIKLYDWRGREKELEEHANPFALFVLAHLQSLATRNDEVRRAESKLRIALNFVDRKLPPADLRQWFRLLDWLLDLPAERDRVIWDQVHESIREKKMPFVDYHQQLEIDRERIGEERGERVGEIKGLMNGIESILRVRFGAEGLALMPQVRQQTDIDRLRRFLQNAEIANTVEELRQQLK